MEENAPKSRIRDFYLKNKRMPSYAEVATILGYTSKNAAYKAVSKLIDDGVLAKDVLGKLIPKNLATNIRILGVVEAGFPTPAEEQVLDTTNLDEYLIDNPDATFMLRVKGDSMYDAGIRDGDMVLAERGVTPKVGQIVVAEVDGAWTMKYLRQAKDKMFLEPANKKYKPIYPKEMMTIAAVVKAVIRKY